MKIGSLFSGYAGLDMAVEAVTGGRTVWHSDIDPGANKILAHHWPDVPNLGDISTVDWSTVEPVDIITGGFPCTDVSAAGKRAGLHGGTRSGLFARMVDAIDALRPSLVVIENVRGLIDSKLFKAYREGKQEYVHRHQRDRVRIVGRVRRAMAAAKRADARIIRAIGTVLGSLADLRYDAAWYGLTASSVGAPHGRFRIFIVAWPDGDAAHIGRDGWTTANRRDGREGPARGPDIPTTDANDAGSQGPQPTTRHVMPDGCTPPANADAVGRDGRSGEFRQGRRRQPANCRDADAHAQGDGRDEGRAESAGLVRGSDAALSGSGLDEFRPETTSNPIGGGRDGWARDEIGSAVGRVATAGPSQDAAPDADSDELWHESITLAWSGGSPESANAVQWGQFEPAIRRWERLTRPAPSPTETSSRGGQRLSPRFVEWMQGLPPGHVTDVPGLTRNEQLKALGNGVVPAQAEAALRYLLDAVAVAA